MATRSLNKAMIIGNLTRDPEMKYTSSGTAITTFGVATNREYSPSNSDEVVKDVEFHNVVAWAGLAEVCDQLLEKGQKVYIEGRLNTRDWEDKETGKKMYRTEIVADQMLVLSPSSSYSSGGSDAGTDSSFGDGDDFEETDSFGKSGSENSGSDNQDDDEEEIPF